ncbi:MAG: penicillin-binding protein activator [Thermodesulfobacteriota bacterium]|nr:penicillin-binding protein activator [Thermodesulfobacteriota bacterium]
MKYMISIVQIFFLSFVFSCTPSALKKEWQNGSVEIDVKKTQTEPFKEEIKKSYNKAKKEYEEGNFDAAIKYIESFMARFPSNERTDDALFMMGDIYLSKKRYDESTATFQKILQDFPTSTLYFKTSLKLAMSYLKSNAFQASVEILKSLVSQAYRREDEVQIYLLMGQSYQGLENYNAAITLYIKAMDTLTDNTQIKEIEEKIKKTIAACKLKNELMDIIAQYQDRFPSSYATFQLAKIFIEEKRFEDAALSLHQILGRYPEHEYRQKIQRLLDIVLNKFSTDIYAIGCILPLSGKYTLYGEKTLRGIELAANVFNPSPEGLPMKLIIKDSQGRPEVAANAVYELANEDNVICIIGPLLSTTAEAAAKKAQEQEVPILVLSQKSKITEIGNFVFRNSLTPNLQAKALADYAIQTLGLTRFAILHPKNHYGEDFMELFWDEILKQDGEVVSIESYRPNQNDFQNEIKRLVGLYSSEDKEDSINEKGIEEQDLSPIIGFDALFIPDYYDKVGLILPQLVYYDVLGIQLLGTSGWNSSQLIKMAREYVQGSIFVDGFFKDSPYPFVQAFINEYKSTFGEEANVLEAQAFDSTNIIIDLINQGVNSRDELKEGLYEVKNYPGVSGATSFNETGDSDKILFTLTIKGDSIIQLR